MAPVAAQTITLLKRFVARGDSFLCFRGMAGQTKNLGSQTQQITIITGMGGMAFAAQPGKIGLMPMGLLRSLFRLMAGETMLIALPFQENLSNLVQLVAGVTFALPYRQMLD